MLGFAGLMAVVVSFDWRFCASKPGFGVPPSTLLLSFVTFTSTPVSVGAECTRHRNEQDCRCDERDSPKMQAKQGPWLSPPVRQIGIRPGAATLTVDSAHRMYTRHELAKPSRRSSGRFQILV